MLTALLVLALACTHFFVGNIKSIRGIPRSRWLSFTGGVSVTYVFLHLLPEFSKAEVEVGAKEGMYLLLPKDSIFLLMLLGFTLFYGLEKLAESSKGAKESEAVKDEHVFYVHIFAFAVYNFILGNFMVEKGEKESALNLIILTAGLIIHFIGNDFSQYSHHKESYLKFGRWILGLAVIAGFIFNKLVFIQSVWILLALALVAGAIIFNSIKEELPSTNKANFLSFFIGVVAYAGLLYLIK